MHPKQGRKTFRIHFTKLCYIFVDQYHRELRQCTLRLKSLFSIWIKVQYIIRSPIANYICPLTVPVRWPLVPKVLLFIFWKFQLLGCTAAAMQPKKVRETKSSEQVAAPPSTICSCHLKTLVPRNLFWELCLADGGGENSWWNAIPKTNASERESSNDRLSLYCSTIFDFLAL